MNRSSYLSLAVGNQEKTDQGSVFAFLRLVNRNTTARNKCYDRSGEEAAKRGVLVVYILRKGRGGKEVKEALGKVEQGSESR